MIGVLTDVRRACFRIDPTVEPRARCGVCSAPLRGVGRLLRDRLHGTPGVFRIVRCPSCGRRQLGAGLDEGQFRQAYPSRYVVRGLAQAASDSWRSRLLEHFVDRIEAARVRLVRRHAAPGRDCRLLDAGCGNATFIRAAVRAGIESPVGLEPDTASVLRACRDGLDVRRGTLTDAAPLGESGFDIVTLWHVLEHTADPLANLRAAAEVLKSGGHVFLGLPDASGLTARIFGQYWFGADLPRHIHQFTAAEVVLLSERAGLHTQAVEHVTEISTLAGSLHNLLRRRWCDRLSDNLFRWVALQAACFPLDVVLRMLGLGDWMVVVLRKPGA